MALLPYLDPSDATPEVRKLLERPIVLNVQRITANAQSIFVARSRLSNACSDNALRSARQVRSTAPPTARG